MIITVDPSQSEDIAAFAMVKQYRLQALKVTLNGGTGSGAWQPVGEEGYTQTVVTPVTGIELVYEDPNAIVSYTVENDDTSNYETASDAGIILSSIEPTNNAWTYTCVFHADSAPVSSVDIDLLVYGNVARGTEQSGSSATAEEITVQVLAGLETRVLALENEMPTKADVATTYTKAQADTLLAGYVTLGTAQTIPGAKTFTGRPLTIRTLASGGYTEVSVKVTDNRTDAAHTIGTNTGDMSIGRIGFFDGSDNFGGYLGMNVSETGESHLIFVKRTTSGTYTSSDVATLTTLDSYLPMVRTTGAQTIGGEKLFTGVIINQRPNYSALVLRNSSVDIVNHDGGEHLFSINFQDKNGVSMATIRAGVGSNGKCSVGGTVRNSNGTTKYYTIAVGD